MSLLIFNQIIKRNLINFFKLATCRGKAQRGVCTFIAQLSLSFLHPLCYSSWNHEIKLILIILPDPVTHIPWLKRLDGLLIHMGALTVQTGWRNAARQSRGTVRVWWTAARSEHGTRLLCPPHLPLATASLLAACWDDQHPSTVPFPSCLLSAPERAKTGWPKGWVLLPEHGCRFTEIPQKITFFFSWYPSYLLVEWKQCFEFHVCDTTTSVSHKWQPEETFCEISRSFQATVFCSRALIFRAAAQRFLTRSVQWWQSKYYQREQKDETGSTIS